MAKKYPNFIFVRCQYDSYGRAYLLAHESAAEVAEINSEIEVAEYKLVGPSVVTPAAEVRKKYSA